ncbi:hypothetical protein MA16_Dca021003 [Dendrobium catenatum]|uniref:Uncharacterized protein n=1 Tax=Dendrobium catenatum TaxID=906689 RepID=A0A2I0VZJ1_9ASPA|nr:hypothetical protein MA16_Dca021003 [Dendrobium catenatum]
MVADVHRQLLASETLEDRRIVPKPLISSSHPLLSLPAFGDDKARFNQMAKPKGDRIIMWTSYDMISTKIMDFIWNGNKLADICANLALEGSFVWENLQDISIPPSFLFVKECLYRLLCLIGREKESHYYLVQNMERMYPRSGCRFEVLTEPISNVNNVILDAISDAAKVDPITDLSKQVEYPFIDSFVDSHDNANSVLDLKAAVLVVSDIITEGTVIDHAISDIIAEGTNFARTKEQGNAFITNQGSAGPRRQLKKLGKICNLSKIFVVRLVVNEEEAENFNADINAIPNFKIPPHKDLHNLYSALQSTPHAPQQDLPQSVVEPSTYPPKQKGEDWDDVVFSSGNISIMRSNIDEQLNNGLLGDNHVDAYAFLLSEKSKIRKDKFQPYLYISPLYKNEVWKSCHNQIVLHFSLLGFLKNLGERADAVLVVIACSSVLVLECPSGKIFDGAMKVVGFSFGFIDVLSLDNMFDGGFFNIISACEVFYVSVAMRIGSCVVGKEDIFVVGWVVL